ncbi:MAG: DUF5011 domain-containing protein [bacterium]|nr:DUF5011 domain-containing protein [bacterium]
MFRRLGLARIKRLALISCLLGPPGALWASLSSSYDRSPSAAFPPIRDQSDGSFSGWADHVLEDTVDPVIYLYGYSTMTLEVGTTYWEPGYSASDDQDGDLTWYVTVSGWVNSYVVGTYVLRYNVSDSHGNAADEKTRTVHVVDTTPPAITLSGDSPLVVPVGTTYYEPGYSATDDYDGNITWRVTVSGSVNSYVVGTYTLRYNVQDSSGNSAPEKVRTVKVVDTMAPVIELLGDNPLLLEVGTWYTEPGYRATDNYDGDITSRVWVVGSVDHNYLGNYTLTYTVSDANGNAAQEKARTVRVVDTTRPVIELLGEETVILEAGTWYTEPGYRATDNYDGDITSRVWVVGSVDPNYLGNYTLRYTVSDANGNPAEEKTRIVQVVDTTPPVIELLGDEPFVLEVGTWYTEPGYTATDNYDGDIASRVWVIGSVDHNYLGDYTLTYTVSDSSGNPAEEKTRLVRVVDTTPPVIKLSGANSVRLKVGTPFVEPGFAATDNYDGDITSDVRVGGSVDHMSPGTYVLRYNITDSSGNPAGEKVRTVEVVDWTLSLEVAQISGVQTGQISVLYAVGHSQSRPCTAAVVFTTDGGISWWRATHGVGGDGLMNLASSPTGEAHTFVWDSVADLGAASTEETVEVRVAMFDGDFSSPAATTGLFSVDNTLADADDDSLPDDWEKRITDFDSDDDIVSPADVSPDADFDRDRKTNDQEYLAGTDPLDAESTFSAQLRKGSYSLSWPSVQGKFYVVYFCEQLGGEWIHISEEIAGNGAGQFFLDEARATNRLGFYQIVVY